MTAAPSRPTRRRPGPVIRVAGCLSGDLFFYGLVWIGVVVGIATVSLIIRAAADEVGHSVWAGAATWPRYVLLAAGVLLAISYLPMFVSHGITRRQFIAGAGLAGAGLVLVVALLGTAGFWLESAIFRALDWAHVLDPDPFGGTGYVFDRPDAHGLIMVWLLASMATHLVSGWLIGATFYRYTPPLGIVLLPLTVLPAVVTEMVLPGGLIGSALNHALGFDPPAVRIGLLVAAAMTVCGVAAVAAVVRRTPIDNRQLGWWR